MTDNKEVLTNPQTFHAKLQEIAGAEAPKADLKPEVEVKDEEVSTNPTVSDEQEEPETESSVESDANETESSESSDEDGYKNRKFIPKSRFNQEIEKRKALEQKWMIEREEKIRLEERLNAFTNMQKTYSAEPAAKEFDLDNIDALDTETHQVYSREIKQLKEELKRTSQQTKQVQYANMVNAQESAFVKDNPDYLTAATYLRDIELAGAKELYGDEAAAKQLVVQKYQQLMGKALETGKSVPETIYKLAKTYGYKGEEKATEAKGGSDIKAINKNMKKSASIGSLGNSVGLSGGIKDINSARKDPTNPRSPFDPAKFKQLLQKAS